MTGTDGSTTVRTALLLVTDPFTLETLTL